MIIIKNTNLDTASMCQYEKKMQEKCFFLQIQNGKAILVTGHGSPQGCEMLRLPYFLDNQFTDGSEFGSQPVLATSWKVMSSIPDKVIGLFN
jgi:hypothetical protein